MIDLKRFNGLWVVCEANYVADVAPDAFSRSITYLSDAAIADGGDPGDWFVAFFTTRDRAERFLAEVVCDAMGNNAAEFKVAEILSLADFERVLRDLVRMGRADIRYDNVESASAEVLLQNIIELRA